MPETKSDLIQQVINTLEADLEVLRKAALETHKSSTNEQSKQEGKYDTRGLEASYLAEAQASKVIQLEQNISKLQQISGDDFDDHESISHGAMVVVSIGDADEAFFLLPAGGGITLQHQGLDFIVVTPDSPIGAALVGMKIGETTELPQRGTSFIADLW